MKDHKFNREELMDLLAIVSDRLWTDDYAIRCSDGLCPLAALLRTINPERNYGNGGIAWSFAALLGRELYETERKAIFLIMGAADNPLRRPARTELEQVLGATKRLGVTV